MLQQRVDAAVSATPNVTRHVVVTFGFASSQLTAVAKTALEGSLDDARNAERIVILGRTDAVGNLKVNQTLARERALAVRDHIRSVAPEADAEITVDAQGGCCFVAPNDTERDRARNRRVEILFMAAGGRG
jgi:outer membrane protein OmpA-like peptidoglycan-associated protein